MKNRPFIEGSVSDLLKPPSALDRPANGVASGDGFRINPTNNGTAGGQVDKRPDGRTNPFAPSPIIPAKAAAGVGPRPGRIPDADLREPRGR
jgi:hypothetical protein